MGNEEQLYINLIAKDYYTDIYDNFIIKSKAVQAQITQLQAATKQSEATEKKAAAAKNEGARADETAARAKKKNVQATKQLSDEEIAYQKQMVKNAKIHEANYKAQAKQQAQKPIVLAKNTEANLKAETITLTNELAKQRAAFRANIISAEQYNAAIKDFSTGYLGKTEQLLQSKVNRGAITQPQMTAGMAGAQAKVSGLGYSFQAQQNAAVNKALAQSSREAAAAVKEQGAAFGSALNAMKAFAIIGLAIAIPMAVINTFKEIVTVMGEYESQLKAVQAVTEGTTEDFMAMDKVAKQLGMDTMFSAKDAAGGLQILVQAGFSAKEAMEAIPGVLDSAAASGIDLASAADQIAVAIKAFRLEAKDATHVADVHAKAMVESRLKGDDFRLGYAAAGAVMKQFSQSLETTDAALAELANAGMRADDAGTSLKSMMLAFITPSAKARDMMKALGINIYDNAGKMKSLSQIVDVMNKATQGMTEKQRNFVFSTIASSDGIRALSILTSQGSAELDRLTESFTNSDGAAKRMADTMNDTLKGDWNQFVSSIEVLNITIGQQLEPTIRRLLQDLTDITNKLIENQVQTQGFAKAWETVINPIRLFIGLLEMGALKSDKFNKSFKETLDIIKILSRILLGVGTSGISEIANAQIKGTKAAVDFIDKQNEMAKAAQRVEKALDGDTSSIAKKKNMTDKDTKALNENLTAAAQLREENNKEIEVKKEQLKENERELDITKRLSPERLDYIKAIQDEISLIKPQINLLEERNIKLNNLLGLYNSLIQAQYAFNQGKSQITENKSTTPPGMEWYTKQLVRTDKKGKPYTADIQALRPIMPTTPLQEGYTWQWNGKYWEGKKSKNAAYVNKMMAGAGAKEPKKPPEIVALETATKYMESIFTAKAAGVKDATDKLSDAQKALDKTLDIAIKKLPQDMQIKYATQLVDAQKTLLESKLMALNEMNDKLKQAQQIEGGGLDPTKYGLGYSKDIKEKLKKIFQDLPDEIKNLPEVKALKIEFDIGIKADSKKAITDYIKKVQTDIDNLRTSLDLNTTTPNIDKLKVLRSKLVEKLAVNKFAHGGNKEVSDSLRAQIIQVNKDISDELRKSPLFKGVDNLYDNLAGKATSGINAMFDAIRSAIGEQNITGNVFVDMTQSVVDTFASAGLDAGKMFVDNLTESLMTTDGAIATAKALGLVTGTATGEEANKALMAAAPWLAAIFMVIGMGINQGLSQLKGTIEGISGKRPQQQGGGGSQATGSNGISNTAASGSNQSTFMFKNSAFAPQVMKNNQYQGLREAAPQVALAVTVSMDNMSVTDLQAIKKSMITIKDKATNRELGRYPVMTGMSNRLVNV